MLADQLNIAGLVPFSSVDWPGKLVAVAFLQGCPWRCPYCHNAQILDPRAKGGVTWEEVAALLRSRRGLLDGIVFSGGEALMQARSGALEAAMLQAKDMGFLVGLHAGGAYPAALKVLLEAGVLDWVGLDIKALPEDYSLATGRSGGGSRAEESLDALVTQDEVDYEVRLTLWPGLVAPTVGAGDMGEALIDYARDVATWVAGRGAKNFALQCYRVPVGTQDATPEIGWDDAKAREAMGGLGFQTLTVR